MTRKSFLACLLSAFVVPFRRKSVRCPVEYRASAKALQNWEDGFKYYGKAKALRERMLESAKREADLVLKRNA